MSEVPHRPRARLYVEPYEVDLRLSQIGVSRGPFIEAALQGDLQRRLCTPDDFGATAGYVGWARGLRVMRAELRRAHGWHNGFLRIPVSYNEHETRAVAVSGGDERIGLPGPDPVTNAKGPATVAAVESNRSPQESFDFEDQGVDLWYLLTYATEDDELRAELSNPSFIDGDTLQISGWHERILFGRIDPDAPSRITAPVAPSNIDFDVPRKTA